MPQQQTNRGKTLTETKMMIHGYWIMVLLFASLPVLARSTAISTLGPIRLSPKRGAFAWNAAVDRATGIASTLETSEAPKRSKLHENFDNNDNDGAGIVQVSNELFASYPSWLCRFPVTFGLVKAVPFQGGGYEIRDRLFGCLFLTFSKPRMRSFTLDTKTPEGSSIQSSTCSITIPITGGLLSRPVPRKEESALVCTLTTQRIREKDAARMRLQSCSIATKLVGFRPWLTGEAPVHPLRAWFYLSTQSLVHAHVTWRLHRHCWKYSRGAGEQKT